MRNFKEEDLMRLFSDTYLMDTDDEDYYDVSEKILKLNDALSEDIILESIKEQMEAGIDAINQRINYITLFKEKVKAITPDNLLYDDEYIKDTIAKVALVVGEELQKKYKVELGDDLDFVTPAEYLQDVETLYEFLFIRHYENLVNLIESRIRRDRNKFIEQYGKLLDENEEHSKDLFVIQSKKKFKNKEDVVIIHFLSDIINDIRDSLISAYSMFEEIVELDKYEKYNYRMGELITLYGNKLVLNDDLGTAAAYLAPLNDASIFTEIRNKVLSDYLADCEINK